MVEIIPLWLVNVVSFTTVFSVMAAIGTTIRPSECLPYLRKPFLLLKGIATAIVIVPAIGILGSFVFGLALPEKVGLTLIVIAPGAPLALRRALASGAHTAFAPTLQISIAVLAVPAVPVWVAIVNMALGTQGFVEPATVAKQILLAQLFPLALGVIVKQATPVWADRIGTILGRAGAVLLLAAILGQIIDLHQVILSAQLRPVIVAVATTAAALLVGHLMGRRLPRVGHSIAVGSALRNVGLALLIAAANQTPPAVDAVIVSYALTAIIMVSIYIALWSRSVGGPEAPPKSPAAA